MEEQKLEHRLLCPSCGVPMRVLKLPELELDECPSCDGLWLDRGEPEVLAGMDVLGKGMLQPVGFDDSTKKVPAGERRCPRCLEVMEVVLHREVEVDICSNCRGMFLDRWELQKLLAD